MPTPAELADILNDASCLDALINRDGVEAVLSDADAEGVDRLIAQLRPDVPAFAARRRQAALEDAVKVREMTRVCEALGQSGVRAAVMKGASLAATHYPQSWCRPRIDLDLLIAPAERPRAARVLAALGYARAGDIEGRWVRRQDSWEQPGQGAVPHRIDLHWDITNRPYFNACLPAHVLLGRAVPAPFAGDGALRLDTVDQLMASCLHRAAHHPNHMKLIWRCDQWRLAQSLGLDEVETLRTRAIAAGIASVCARDLREAREWLGDGPRALSLGLISTLDIAGRREFARRFLASPRGRLGDLWLDLRSLPRWRDRAMLLREHLAPAPDFIRGPGAPSPGFLPYRYVRRLVRGAWHWLRETRAP